MKELKTLRLAFLNVVAFFSRHIHASEKLDAGSMSAQLSVITDIDNDTWILTIHFLENLGNVFVEIVDSAGEMIYYESVETTVCGNISILLTYEKIGDYCLSVICEDKLLHSEVFGLY